MNKLFLILIAFISVFFLEPFIIVYGTDDQIKYWAYFWSDKWFYTICAVSALLAWRLPHWSLKLSIGFALISAAWAFGFHYREPQLEPAYAYIAIALTTIALMGFDAEDFKFGLKTLGVIGICNAIIICIEALYGLPRGDRGGLFGNPSISGCFTAFTFIYWTNRYTFLFGVVGVLLCATSQPIGVLAVTCAAYVAWSPPHWKQVSTGAKKSYRYLIGAIVLVAALIVIPITTSKHGRSPFDDSGRLSTWKTVMPVWYKYSNIWVGTGTGTAAVIVPKIQASEEGKKHKAGDRFNIEEYKWMHSDWLQMLFENGIIGLTLYLITATIGLMKAYQKSRELFASMIGFMSSMIFNWPIRMPVHMMFGALLIGYSFYKRREI